MKPLLYKIWLGLICISLILTWWTISSSSDQPWSWHTILVLFSFNLTAILMGALSTLIVYNLRESLHLLTQTVQQTKLRANDETALKFDLDAGLAGDQQARQRYLKHRLMSDSLIPLWVQTDIANQIAAWVKSAKRSAKYKSSTRAIGHLERFIPTMLYRAEPIQAKLAEVDRQIIKHRRAYQRRVARLRLKLLVLRKPDTTATLKRRIESEQEQQAFREDVRELFHQLVTVAFHGLLIQDFLAVHPCTLTDTDRSMIAREVKADPWDLLNVNLVHRIILAEAELADIFERHQATTIERAEATRRLAKGAITERSIQRVDEWLTYKRLEAKRPKPVPVSQPVAPVAQPSITKTVPPAPVVVDLQTALKQFARSLTHLSRTEQNLVIRFVIKLNREGLLDTDLAMAELEEYTGDDQHTYIIRRYHDLAAKPSYQANGSKVPLRVAAKPQYRKLETATDILTRLDNEAPINLNDITKLSKLYRDGQVPDDQTYAAIRHILCYRLAHGSAKFHRGKHRPYRIHLASVPIRCTPHGCEEIGRTIVADMVSNGELLYRDNELKTPTASHPVKLSPELMHKYRGIT